MAAMNAFDPADYSVVVKHRGKPPKPWRWEIYCAGRKSSLVTSTAFFSSIVVAHKAGKEALRLLLAGLNP
jgi:hypothetical protein